MLVSYSIAEEGSNNLYIGLIEAMLTQRDPSTYNMVEIEMILNYFPHQIWSSEDELKPLRDKFYYPILLNLQENLEKLDNRALTACFQCMVLAGHRLFTQDLLNRFLN